MSSSPATDTRAMIREAFEAAARHGFGELRPKQVETLESLSRRVPTFAALPTGYGKSLCAWLPALAWDWRVWILSPLVSLIEDQALACAERGIEVVAWKGGLDQPAKRELRKRMLAGRTRITILSPERFLLWRKNGFFSELNCRGLGPDLFVLDEMHCLEEWRNFREGYRDLSGPLRHELGLGSAVLGLSASLSLREADAWLDELVGHSQRAIVSAGLGRENLRLSVIPIETEGERWLQLISSLRGLRDPESALVYCRSRSEADDVARWLRSAGFEAVAYHAGLPASERAERSRAFRAGQLRVVCATTAFGMGIDYPFVSLVVHFSLPHDLASYWQEVGRAGRGGAEARAVALWRRSEITRARRMGERERSEFIGLWLAWSDPGCRKAAIARQLGHAEEVCGKCDRCVPAEAPAEGISRAAWWSQSYARLSEWVREREEESF